MKADKYVSAAANVSLLIVIASLATIQLECTKLRDSNRVEDVRELFAKWVFLTKVPCWSMTIKNLDSVLPYADYLDHIGKFRFEALRSTGDSIAFGCAADSNDGELGIKSTERLRPFVQFVPRRWIDSIGSLIDFKHIEPLAVETKAYILGKEELKIVDSLFDRADVLGCWVSGIGDTCRWEAKEASDELGPSIHVGLEELPTALILNPRNDTNELISVTQAGYFPNDEAWHIQTLRKADSLCQYASSISSRHFRERFERFSALMGIFQRERDRAYYSLQCCRVVETNRRALQQQIFELIGVSDSLNLSRVMRRWENSFDLDSVLVPFANISLDRATAIVTLCFIEAILSTVLLSLVRAVQHDPKFGQGEPWLLIDPDGPYTTWVSIPWQVVLVLGPALSCVLGAGVLSTKRNLWPDAPDTTTYLFELIVLTICLGISFTASIKSIGIIAGIADGRKSLPPEAVDVDAV